MSSLKPIQPDKKQIFLWNRDNQAVLNGEINRYMPRAKHSNDLLVGLVILLVFSVLLEWTDIHLEQVGRPITATVVSRRTTISHGKSGDTTNYLITYQFSLPDGGATFSHESNVGETVYQQSETGTPIEVIYDPKSPESSDTRANVMRIPFFTLASLVTGIVAGVIYWRRWHTLSRLRNEGVVTPARLELVYGKRKLEQARKLLPEISVGDFYAGWAFAGRYHQRNRR